MARNSRMDLPASWHHVMNRGIARRTVFERREDIRYFLSRIARAVRRGEIEVHAFCVLATHFHLLVRSPRGELAEAMRRIQNEFVRWFNRSRKRDGPLFRGRFRSKPVTSLIYRRILVRYIDANPVSAGLVEAAHMYAYGSARAYAKLSGPLWLARSWIEGVARDALGSKTYDPRGYALAFGEAPSTGMCELVELRISNGCTEPDPLDELVGLEAGQVLAWMRRRAELADQTRPGLPVCGVASVTKALERARASVGQWSITPGKKGLDAWTQVHAALLRDLAGTSAPRISLLLGCSESSVSRMRARHRALMRDEEYAERVRAIAAGALRACGLGGGAIIGRELS